MKKIIEFLVLLTMLSIADIWVSQELEKNSTGQNLEVVEQEVEDQNVLILLKGIDEEIHINERIEIEEGQTLEEVMIENFDTVIEDGFVVSINEFGGNEKENTFIVYDINGEMGVKPVSDLILEDGDEIIWKVMEF